MQINTSLLDKPKQGIVYILYIDIEYEDKLQHITKIGVTTRDVEARVTEILISIWKGTRIFPRCYVKRFKTVQDPYGMESELLSLYKDREEELITNKFSGATECFLLNEEDRGTLIDKYETMTSSDTYKKK